jgi:hypothetical protein
MKEGVFLGFLGVTNGVHRFSSIKDSNDIVSALLYPWTDLVDRGPAQHRGGT